MSEADAEIIPTDVEDEEYVPLGVCQHCRSELRWDRIDFSAFGDEYRNRLPGEQKCPNGCPDTMLQPTRRSHRASRDPHLNHSTK